MNRVVAIHHREGSFSERWLQCSPTLGLQPLAVDGLSSSIIDRLAGCEAFLWHLSQDLEADLKFARSVLLAAEGMGMRTFPNHATCWHFDDKIAQKYLLESIGAPLAPTWAFFSKADALSFLKEAEYPLVFKLRRGAGSLNVQLVESPRRGESLVRQMFARGMRPFPAAERLRRGVASARTGMATDPSFRVRLMRAARRWLGQTVWGERERGYVLLQRLIPGNDHDVRVTVIGDRAFVFFRGVRPNDFRASGSGLISYPRRDQIPRDVIQIACNISQRLGFQSMAYDFVRDQHDKRPLLLEMSFVFSAQAVFDCPGHCLTDGSWHEGPVWPQDAVLGDLMA